MWSCPTCSVGLHWQEWSSCCLLFSTLSLCWRFPPSKKGWAGCVSAPVLQRFAGLCIEMCKLVESSTNRYGLFLPRYKYRTLLESHWVVSTGVVPVYISSGWATILCCSSCRMRIRQTGFIDMIWNGLKLTIELCRFCVNKTFPSHHHML